MQFLTPEKEEILGQELSCKKSLKIRTRGLYDLLTRRWSETIQSCKRVVLVQREEQKQTARTLAEAIFNKCRLILSVILT